MKGKSLKEAIHETAQGFYEAGVMDEQTMHEFDVMCRNGSKVKNIRVE